MRLTCLVLALSFAPSIALAQDAEMPQDDIASEAAPTQIVAPDAGSGAPSRPYRPPPDVPPQPPPPPPVQDGGAPQIEPVVPRPPCVPRTCQPEDRGIVPDGCGGILSCEEPFPPELVLTRPSFGEDGGPPGTEGPEVQVGAFQLAMHGYFRGSIRASGDLQRPPYLTDDDYFLSGFNYTRVNEREWAEVFFSAEYEEHTRLVLGFFASQFSDWSETTLQGQGGIATAFVEHTLEIEPGFEIGGRAGMFWDRYGYLPAYDTYLIGRTHIGGLRLHAKLFDMIRLRAGFGAHADVISSNQGFTPVVWFSAGLELPMVEATAYAFYTYTRDSEREFAIIEDASLTVLGIDGRVLMPHVGQAYLGLAHYRADQVLYLANGLELLHSTGGRGLTENFFGLDSENGTGEILSFATDITLQPWRTVAALDRDAGRALRGLDLRLFGLLAWVRSKQVSEDPLENRDDRVYLKWGTEVFYRPAFPVLDHFFAALRFDRVILDTDHDSLSFRSITPRIGVTPIPNLDFYLALSIYRYGSNVTLRPNQIPGDVAARNPDETVLKMQAQLRF